LVTRCNTDPGLTKTFFTKAGYFPRVREPEELFDTWFDACERRNLAGDPAYRAILADMRMRLTEHMRRYGDPLLTHTGGMLPVPPTAKVNYASAVNADKSEFLENRKFSK
jgi:hypothetical protein